MHLRQNETGLIRVNVPGADPLKVISFEEEIMPTESIVVLAFVGLLFATFMAGLAYADRSTRDFRE